MHPGPDRYRKSCRGHRGTVRNSYPLTSKKQLGKQVTITKAKNKRGGGKKKRKKHFVLEGLMI